MSQLVKNYEILNKMMMLEQKLDVAIEIVG